MMQLLWKTLWYISSKSFNRIGNKDSNFYANGHNIIHNSQKMGTRLFIAIWLDKQRIYIHIYVYTHTQRSISHKKVYIYTHNEMSVIKRNELLIHAITWKESWRHVKWNKPETKRQILYDFSRIGTFIETKSRMMVTRRYGREAGWGVTA